MKIGYLTDKGKRRSKNEAAIRVLYDQKFFMLADGVGGNKSGEVASTTALQALANFTEHNPLSKLENDEQAFRYFDSAIEYVNKVINTLSEKEPEYAGMATTLVCAYIDGDKMYIANVGDSRVYIVQDGEIKQITEDHTYVNDLVKMGAITKEEAGNHARKNVITRAIGANAYNKADCFCEHVGKDDKVLICSDGLYDELSEKEMLEHIINQENMVDCAEELVDMANTRGGSDNISVICISMVED